MKKYFYSNGEGKEGPLTLEELKQKDINPKTLIWFEGLDDWKEAETIEELREIFELLPPPIINENEEVSLNNEIKDLGKNKKAKKISLSLGLKEANDGWIIAGFIFAFFGGLLGIIIGANYAFGKYKKETKRLGWGMIILGILMIGIWRYSK
jgi:hypothetical protein